MRGTQHGRRWRQHLDYRWIQLQPFYETGSEMESTWATDRMSRRKTAWWEWKVRTSEVARVVRALGLAGEQARMIDLFAEPATRRWSRYVTRSVLLGEGKLWTDALTRTWRAGANPLIAVNDILWIFPPPRLWPNVVTRLRELRAGQQAVLIVAEVGAPVPLYEWIAQHQLRRVKLPSLADLLTPPEGRHNSEAFRGRAAPKGTWVGVHILLRGEQHAGTPNPTRG